MPNSEFFTTIVDIAHERVVTAADFEPFIGQENWLAFSRGEERGSDCDEFCSGVVWNFRLDGIAAFGDNKVVITLLHPDEDIEVLVMDADELAIRIDAS